MLTFLLAVVYSVLVSVVDCQLTNETYVPLSSGQEFYAGSAIYKTGYTKSHFAYGGWFKSSIIIRLMGYNVSATTLMTSTGGSLNVIFAGTANGTKCFPALTWVYIVWAKLINTGTAPKQLLDKDGNLADFYTVSADKIYSSRGPNPVCPSNDNDSQEVAPYSFAKNEVNRTYFFKVDLQLNDVITSDLFYSLHSGEPDLKEKLMQYMVGLYKGDMYYFRANKLNPIMLKSVVESASGGVTLNRDAMMGITTKDGLYLAMNSNVHISSFLQDTYPNIYPIEYVTAIKTYLLKFTMKSAALTPTENNIDQVFGIYSYPVGINGGNISLDLYLGVNRYSGLCMFKVVTNISNIINQYLDSPLSNIRMDNATVSHFSFKISMIHVQTGLDTLVDINSQINLIIDISRFDHDTDTIQSDQIIMGPIQLGIGFSEARNLKLSTLYTYSTDIFKTYLDTLAVLNGGINMRKISLSTAGFDDSGCTHLTSTSKNTSTDAQGKPYCLDCTNKRLLDVTNGQCYLKAAASNYNPNCSVHYTHEICDACANDTTYNQVEHACGCTISGYQNYPQPLIGNTCLLLALADLASSYSYFSYLNGNTWTCSSGCSTCRSTPCDSCPVGKGIYTFGRHKACRDTPSFGDGVGIAGTPGILRPCLSSNCKNCAANYTRCTECMPGYVFHGSNKACVKCDAWASRIYNLAESHCDKCSTDCLTCNGTESYRCLTCYTRNSSKYLLELIPGNASCDSCNSSKEYYNPARDVWQAVYQDNSDPVKPMCRWCDSTCKSCTNSSTCVDCNSTHYLLDNLTCSNCTVAGTFKNDTDRTCKACPGPYCIQCKQQTGECTRCSANYFVNDSSKTCSKCEPTSGWFIANANMCKKCDTICKYCFGVKENCTDCPKGRYLMGSSCLPCHASCDRCNNGSMYDCTECPDGKYKYKDNSCGACNEIGYSSSKSDKRCVKCLDQCKTCSYLKPGNCLSCYENFYILPNNSCGVCNPDEGYYFDSDQCEKCHESCKTCYGGDETNCMSCELPRKLQISGRCTATSIKVIESRWDSASSSAVFTFDDTILPNGNKADLFEGGVFDLPLTSLEVVLGKININTPLSAIPELTATKASIESIDIRAKSIAVPLKIESTLSNVIVIVRAKKNDVLISGTDQYKTFNNTYLILGNITQISTAFDAVITKTAATATVVVSIITLPQAFVLLKLFNSLDLYVFVDVKYPPNFEKLLQMLTQTVMDYMPNIFLRFADDEGSNLPERFIEYGYEVHFFKNFGESLTVIMILGAIKLIILPWRLPNDDSKIANHSKIRRAINWLNNVMGPEFWVNFLEGVHIDFLLSVLVYLTMREKVDEWKPVNYLIIVFMSGAVLALVFFYGYLMVKTKSLTESYFKHAVLPIADMKDEPMRFILADKDVYGNIFQRYFAVIMLLREFFLCLIVYFLVMVPTAVASILSLTQLLFTIGAFVCPPFTEGKDNLNQRITTVLYLLLNLCLLVLAIFGDKLTETFKYWVVGFTMIAVLVGLVISNIGFTLYYTAVEYYQKWKEHRASQQELKQMDDSSLDNSKNNVIHPEQDAISHKSTKSRLLKIAAEKTTPLGTAQPDAVKGPLDSAEKEKINAVKTITNESNKVSRKDLSVKKLKVIPAKTKNAATDVRNKVSSNISPTKITSSRMENSISSANTSTKPSMKLESQQTSQSKLEIGKSRDILASKKVDSSLQDSPNESSETSFREKSQSNLENGHPRIKRVNSKQ